MEVGGNGWFIRENRMAFRDIRERLPGVLERRSSVAYKVTYFESEQFHPDLQIDSQLMGWIAPIKTENPEITP